MKRAASLVAVLAWLGWTAACKGTPTTPFDKSDPLLWLTQTIETEHFIFHYTPGDLVDQVRSEAYYEWAAAFLGVSLRKKVDYFKFKDREQLYRITGSTGTGWAQPNECEVWTYLPWQNHEYMHLFSLALGDPPILFSEGTAVAYQVDPLNGDFVARFNGEPVHDLARGLKARGLLEPLEGLLDDAGWYAADFTTTYIEAGSFVRYLADARGIELVKEVFRRIRQVDAKDLIKERFLSIYGLTVQEAEAAWLAFLD